MKENNREISILKQRILNYLEKIQASKYECYKNTGITNGVLSQSNGMSEENLLKFLSYYDDVSTEWLLRGEGEMMKASPLKPVSHHVEQNSVTEDSFMYKIYQDQLKMYQKEKEENKTLIKQNTILEERIRQLEADNESLRSQSGADRITDTFTDLPLVDYEEDYPPVERPSSSKHPLAGKA